VTEVAAGVMQVDATTTPEAPRGLATLGLSVLETLLEINERGGIVHDTLADDTRLSVRRT
jgi:hypothetical protein